MTTSELLNGSGLSVSLTVKNLQESLRWYHELVGFALDRKIERDGQLRGVVITAGNVRMLLNQDDGAKEDDGENGHGSGQGPLYESVIREASARTIVTTRGANATGFRPHGMLTFAYLISFWMALNCSCFASRSSCVFSIPGWRGLSSIRPV